MDKSIAKQIHFDENYTTKQLKLFDFPESVVKELNSSKMVIRSDKDGNAYFVTDTVTYKIIKVENSNTQLVKKNNEIDGRVYCYYELEKFCPSLGPVYEMMKKSYYVPNQQSNVNFTLDDIYHEITASKEEIKVMLKSLKCVEIGDHWKMIEPKAYQDVFNMILLCIQEIGATVDHFRKYEVMTNIPSDYDDLIVDFVMENTGKDNEDGSWQLYFDKVAQFKALSIFETQKKISKDKFMKLWQDSLSFVAKEIPTLEMIKEFIVLTEKNEILYVDRDGLPTTPDQRLETLFKMNLEWLESELFVFMSDLIDAQTLSKMLKKTARSKTSTKGKVYFK